jgi:hypothetical protein
MQPPFPLGFAPCLHQQFQFLAFPFSQEAQQGLDFAVVILVRSMPRVWHGWR